MQMHNVVEIETRQEAINMFRGAGYNPIWICEADTMDSFIISDKDCGWFYVNTISGGIREATQQEYDRFCIEG